MTLLTGLQILLDGLLIYAASRAVFGDNKRAGWHDAPLALLFTLYCFIGRISVAVGVDTTPITVAKQGYEIVPVNDIALFLFLVLVVMVTVSIWYGKNAVYTLFGTLSVFSIFIIVRQIFLLLFFGLGMQNNTVSSLLCRLCSAVLVGLFTNSPLFKWLREKHAEGTLPTKLLAANTFAVLCALLVFFDFDTAQTAGNVIVIAGVLFGLAIIDLSIGIYAQKHSQERKRIRMLEQYLPVIEELITQVRTRQHEFDNRLLAISAAVQTAPSLEQAQREIVKLTTGVQLSISEKSLLLCDSKITAGMIYSKIKNASMKKITVTAEIAASLKNTGVREIDIVEVVGILMDNAVEASNSGDDIHVCIEHQNHGLCIFASNPYKKLSATEFVQLFSRGYSTKAISHGMRGYGLANVKEIVQRYNGKLITHNETKQGKNYITIGALLP